MPLSLACGSQSRDSDRRYRVAVCDANAAFTSIVEVHTDRLGLDQTVLGPAVQTAGALQLPALQLQLVLDD